MKRILLTAFIVGSLLSMHSALVAQGKVTVDPNANSKKAKASQDEIDARLSKKITYDSGYKRLHTIADDLTKLTGVGILSGQSKNDWRVRDIPVVVCVKDMPLGKVLKAIAAATHTRLISEVIGDDTKKSYRIYRRVADEQDIDAVLQNRHDVRLAQAKWQWDALVAYGKSKEIPGLKKDMWLLAKFIASLGPEAKDKIFNGDMLRFSGRDLKCHAAIDDMYRLAWENSFSGENRNAALPSINDIETSVMQIKLVDSGIYETRIQVVLSPLKCDNMYTSWVPDLGQMRSLEGKGLDLPPYPRDTKTQTRKDDMNDPNFTIMLNKKDWDFPSLKVIIDLEKPKELSQPTYADLIHELALKSGCNIIAEDFVSHMDSNYQRVNSMFKNETTTADTLYNLPWTVYGTWFFNDKDNLLIGWADEMSRENTWRDHHRNMLSEEYLDSLKIKLNSSGVELEDAVHLMSISQKSFDDWIYRSRDFTKVERLYIAKDLAFWQIYDILEPADKLAANSNEGLSLAKYDPNWIASFFYKQKFQDTAYTMENIRPEADEQGVEQEHKLKERAMSDSQVIHTMIMRIEKTPAKYRFVRSTNEYGLVHLSQDTPSTALKLYNYSMVINYKIDGEDRKMDICGPTVPLPIRSSEREIEIIKAAEEKSKNNK